MRVVKRKSMVYVITECEDGGIDLENNSKYTLYLGPSNLSTEDILRFEFCMGAGQKWYARDNSGIRDWDVVFVEEDKE